MTTQFYQDDESFVFSDTDSESDSTLFKEFLYSSSSVDRSSVNSIPWAEDAIKQNQQDWERLERIFYGEEDLPEDGELRNEIVEWQRRFPHLRVSGVGIGLHTRDQFSAKSLQPVGRKYSNADLVDMLRNDLRISSVPIVARANQTTHDLYLKNNHKSTKHAKSIQTRKAESLLLTARDQHHQFTDPLLKLSNSASLMRMPMPPIINVNTPKSTRVQIEPMSILVYSRSAAKTRNSNWQTQKSALSGKINKNCIILPSLNPDHRSLPYDNDLASGRRNGAISAVRSANYLPLPFSASRFKMSK